MRTATIENRTDHNVGILNLSLFYNVSDTLFVGVEAGYGISWNDRKENQGVLRGIVEF